MMDAEGSMSMRPALARDSLSPLRMYAAFCRTHPHSPVPDDHVTENGYRLGRWQTRQRVARMLGTLPASRISELDAIGFVWAENGQPLPAVARTDSKRRRMLTAIAAYREEHGDALVPVNYLTDDGEQVGQWLYRAVKKWRAHTLPDEERAPLAVLGVSPAARPRGPRTAA
ncbi:helicase associated domain-containing protein [Rhodococcus koreensis]|uniref:helicase associated domain-containing protein n=1 Tax=Rhodococcus koreensis TaxID=99653 RepID=UPI00197F3159|nr:helicase associated domain-containing protein [Rhodococcus koreensis]QSE84684.1 helicase associated domain-containing protein [Rhodococcus koreensis]